MEAIHHRRATQDIVMNTATIDRLEVACLQIWIVIEICVIENVIVKETVIVSEIVIETDPC